MRKTIALILALTMVFALCACGNSAKNEASQNFVHVGEVNIAGNSTRTNATNIAPPTTEDYLAINNVVLEELNGKLYLPNIDVKCIFPQNIVDDYPNQLFLYFQYLDKNGEIVNTVKLLVENLSYNYGGWSDTIGHITGSDATLDISKVETIVFTHYEMMNFKNGSSWKESWDFLNPMVYKVSDLVPKNVIEDAKNGAFDSDPVAVEAVFVEKKTTTCVINMKIRNTGSNRRDVIKLYYQILDKTGDIILSNDIAVFGVEPGQAARTDNSFSVNCLAEEIGSIKITDYAYGEGSDRVYTVKREGKFELIDPIIISADDIMIK